MTHGFFTTLFYQPLYIGLIFLINIIPWADVGIAVILFTCVVKLILFPLSKSAVRTQILMKKSETEMNALKEKYKNNKQEQAQKLMAFYKEKKINPFSSFFLILIQLPIIIALYQIFLKSGLPNVTESLLYSFVQIPTFINMNFLGILDISKRSLLLAVLAGVTAYLQARFAMPSVPPKTTKASFKDDLARSMVIQAKYMLPIFIFLIAYTVSGAVSLYLITSNVFTVGQELVIRKRFKDSSEENK
jgi:YidC/Oxa1 family membrane protein insertase